MANKHGKRTAAALKAIPYPTKDEAIALRLALGMSQPQFALFLCTSISAVQKWEAGESRMHRGLAKLARVTASKPQYEDVVRALPKPSAKMAARLRSAMIGDTYRPGG